jgi:activator of 2-hydroxyglutaryl-CoA dehydratase
LHHAAGVFAKTDVQPLINEGARMEDIAVSIFQAVVNQTISGLACGRPIKGNIAFLGGPLNYLSELRGRFIKTLNLTETQSLVPEEAHLIVAKGAAMSSTKNKIITSKELLEKIEKFKNTRDNSSKALAPLFSDKKEYTEFKKRHETANVEKINLVTFEGDCFLGIDAGSTTSKIVLINEER